MKKPRVVRSHRVVCLRLLCTISYTVSGCRYSYALSIHVTFYEVRSVSLLVFPNFAFVCLCYTYLPTSLLRSIYRYIEMYTIIPFIPQEKVMWVRHWHLPATRSWQGAMTPASNTLLAGCYDTCQQHAPGRLLHTGAQSWLLGQLSAVFICS